VLSLPAFSRADGHGCQFSENDFDELISHLIALDLIEKTADSEIIAGLGAGRLTSHYSFYSVFAGAAEYRVTAGGREIGYVNFIPPEGSNIVLGGRYWRVENVAQREKEIMVSHSESGGGLLWRGSGVDLHKCTAAGMRKVLAENSAYPYLTQRAGLRLAEARELAKLWRLGEEIFIPAAEKEQFVLIPWLGSRSMRALLLVLQNREYRRVLGIRSLSRENEFSINICSSLSIPIFSTELAGILRGHTTHDSLYSLIDPSKIPLTGKLDSYLPAKALIKQYAEAMLDVEWGELSS
jgi:ATP-dependent Lhr-like helicase